ncbi:GAF domain-containing protein [Rhizobium leguminosarum]
MITPTDLMGFQSDLARTTDAIGAFRLFEAKSEALFGHILFTSLRFDYRGGVMTRLYSNREDVSPIGGTKPIPVGIWADRIVACGQAHIGYSREDLKDVFFDYESLWAIGCESVMNVPVRWQDRTVGSFNVLGRADQFDNDDAATLGLLAQCAVPLFFPGMAGSVTDGQ